MKISFISIYNFIIYTILVLNLGFFNLIYQSDRIAFKISIVLALIVFIIYTFQPNKISVKKSISLYLILCLSLFMIEFLRNSRPFVISNEDLIYQFGGVFLCLVLFPINEILSSDKKTFLTNLVVMGYIILLIKATVWFLYNFLQINIAPGIWGYKIDWAREIFGHVFTRLSGTFLDSYLLIYSFYTMISKDKEINKRIYAGIGLLFLFFYATVVTQYRMIVVLYLLTILLLIFILSYKSKNKAASLILLLLILCLLLIINRAGIKSFISSFSVNNNITGGSTSFRLLELDFFKSLWLQNNIGLGFGFIPDKVIPYNGAGYYLSDLGFTANLYQFGIIGFAILIFPFLMGIKLSLIHLSKSNISNNKLYFIFVGLTIYIVMSLLPYSPYNPSLVSLMPIYLAILNSCELDFRQ